MITAKNLLWSLLLGVVLLAACGHSRRVTAFVPDNDTLSSGTTSPASPGWLADALAELEALERPADVNPGLFADIKADLARLLRERASGKMASSISADHTKVLDLRFQQDSPEADVFLEWGYVNRRGR